MGANCWSPAEAVVYRSRLLAGPAERWAGWVRLPAGRQAGRAGGRTGDTDGRAGEGTVRRAVSGRTGGRAGWRAGGPGGRTDGHSRRAAVNCEAKSQYQILILVVVSARRLNRRTVVHVARPGGPVAVGRRTPRPVGRSLLPGAGSGLDPQTGRFGDGPSDGRTACSVWSLVCRQVNYTIYYFPFFTIISSFLSFYIFLVLFLFHLFTILFIFASADCI